MVAQRMSRSAPSPPRSSALARRPFLRCCTLVDAWGLWVRVVPSRAPGESGLAARRGHGGAARAGVAALTLGALGVVFGDIGTSPLYALHMRFGVGLAPRSCWDLSSLGRRAPL